MKKILETFHPAVIFLYFTGILIFTMVYMHPIFLGLSFFGGAAAAFALDQKRARRYALGILPIIIVAAGINPLFNHQGGTILAYFPSGTPLTLESILFGAGAACMLGAVLFWFFALNRIMTMDKVMALLGGILPGAALLLSMTMRFAARFREQFQQVRRGQLCMGIVHGGRLGKFRGAVRILSVMVTWCFENGLDTADAMNSRGYGLRGRTSFSLYRFTKRDGFGLACIFALWVLILVGIGQEGIYYAYFPFFYLETGAWTAVGCGAFLALCFLPVILSRLTGNRLPAALCGPRKEG